MSLAGRPQEDGGHKGMNISLDEETRNLLRNPEMKGSASELVEHSLSEIVGTVVALTGTIEVNGSHVTGLAYLGNQPMTIETFPVVGAITPARAIEYYLQDGTRFTGIIVGCTLFPQLMGDSIGSIIGTLVPT